MKTLTAELRDKLHTLFVTSPQDSLASELAAELLQEEVEIPAILTIIDSNDVVLVGSKYQSGDRASLEAVTLALKGRYCSRGASFLAFLFVTYANHCHFRYAC